jgi:hypothetical protein
LDEGQFEKMASTAPLFAEQRRNFHCDFVQNFGGEQRRRARPAFGADLLGEMRYVWESCQHQ